MNDTLINRLIRLSDRSKPDDALLICDAIIELSQPQQAQASPFCFHYFGGQADHNKQTELAHHARVASEHAAMLEMLGDAVRIMERGGKVNWAEIGEEYGLDTNAPDLMYRVIDAVREECRSLIKTVEQPS